MNKTLVGFCIVYQFDGMDVWALHYQAPLPISEEVFVQRMKEKFNTTRECYVLHHCPVIAPLQTVDEMLREIIVTGRPPEQINRAVDPAEHLRHIQRELDEMGIGKDVDVNGGDAVDYLNKLRTRINRTLAKEV